MKELQRLIKKLGGKREASEQLEITVRYVDMILRGKKPSKRIVRLIKIYLAS